MNRNKNQITSAEAFIPFKAFFQKQARGGPRESVTYYHPLNRWTDLHEN
jgi:hypothetical protein